MSRKLNVYLCGNRIGVLCENELLQLSFQYCSDNVSPLSVHLPVRTDEYTNADAFPFFENLAPEGEAFEILSKDHVSGNKVFSILDRYGGDCAGAVAFYETMPHQQSDSNLHEISPVKVVQIIDRLPEDPLLTSLEDPPRLSLAGAQSKFAVHKHDGKYYRSDDEHPTTHIIKITNKRFPNLLENELFCMKLAKILQLETPGVEIKIAEGRPTESRPTESRRYLEIERFDRCYEKEIVRRVHQEDFCQALGIVSDMKYQAGGGASLKDCCKIIEEFSENRLNDITRLIEWIIFNYLIGNTDAHAKNISLLHTNNGIRLAPFYDLLSTEVYSERLVDHTMAMLVNGKGKYHSLTPRDFLALFGHLGLNATNMMKIIKTKFVDIVPVAENLRETVKETPEEAIFDDIIAIIKKRRDALLT